MHSWTPLPPQFSVLRKSHHPISKVLGTLTPCRWRWLIDPRAVWSAAKVHLQDIYRGAQKAPALVRWCICTQYSLTSAKSSLCVGVTPWLRVNCSGGFWSVYVKKQPKSIQLAAQTASSLSFSSLYLNDIKIALFWWVPESNYSEIKGQRSLLKKNVF